MGKPREASFAFYEGLSSKENGVALANEGVCQGGFFKTNKEHPKKITRNTVDIFFNYLSLKYISVIYGAVTQVVNGDRL